MADDTREPDEILPPSKELKQKTGLTRTQAKAFAKNSNSQGKPNGPLRRFPNTMRGHRFGPPGQKESARVMQRVIQRHEALKLKAKGMSYFEIAQHMGLSNETAYKYVQEAAGELDQEARIKYAPRYREIECETLDFALRNLVSIVMGYRTVTVKGKPVVERVDPQHQVAAANSLVRIVERRAKLLGLDAPTKIAPTTPDGRPLSGMSDEELDARLAALAEESRRLPAVTSTDDGGDGED